MIEANEYSTKDTVLLFSVVEHLLTVYDEMKTESTKTPWKSNKMWHKTILVVVNIW